MYRYCEATYRDEEEDEDEDEERREEFTSSRTLCHFEETEQADPADRCVYVCVSVSEISMCVCVSLSL